jgi:hypothetical protein
MLTFNDIKNAIVASKPNYGKVCLVLNEIKTPISGVCVTSGSLWVVPVDRNAAQIQVTVDHTITTLP